MEGLDSVEGSSRLFGTQDSAIGRGAVVESFGHLGTGQESFPPPEQQGSPAPLSPDTDEPSAERKGHCCAWDCCCREPDLWGKGYCSCGLLKWYCSGKHQCMQLADECAPGTDTEEPPVWETYRLFSSWGKTAGYGPSTPASWPREDKGDSLLEKTECRRDSSCEEDHSSESSPCSVLLNQTNSSYSRTLSTASPEETQSEEEWGTASMWWSQEWRTQGAMEPSERWRHFGEWKVDEECSDEDCMCNAICSCDEECSCNEVDDGDECILNGSALQTVDIYSSRWKASLDPENICEGALPKDGHRPDIKTKPIHTH
ncbi:uncharacterized protein LOC144783393 [Lissotriton helveticus]